MEPLKVGDYVTWDLEVFNQWPGKEQHTWPARYGNLMIVTQIDYGAGDWLRVRRANGKRNDGSVVSGLVQESHVPGARRESDSRC